MSLTTWLTSLYQTVLRLDLVRGHRKIRYRFRGNSTRRNNALCCSFTAIPALVERLEGRVVLTADGVADANALATLPALLENETAVSFQLFTDANRATPGLVGSYVNQNLRSIVAADDWRTTQVISGTRIDTRIDFDTPDWGSRATVGITGGTDDDWSGYSVQWDGYVEVTAPEGTSFLTRSDDGSRFWIDLNGDGAFNSSGPEFTNNHWGSGQATTNGDVSQKVNPGLYKIRIQYEEGIGGNVMELQATYDLPFVEPTDPKLTLGPRSQLVIRVNVHDGQLADNGDFSDAKIHEAAKAVNVFYDRQSFGRTTFPDNLLTIVPGTFTLPYTKAQLEDANVSGSVTNPIDILHADAEAIAAAQGYNIASYQHVIVIHPSLSGRFGYGGLGDIGDRRVWLNGNLDIGIWAHELGHNLGHGHYHAEGPGDVYQTIADPEDMQFLDKADDIDLFLNGGRPTGSEFAFTKVKSNWLTLGTEAVNVTASGTYRLNATDEGGPIVAGRHYALRVRRNDVQDYWLEYRVSSEDVGLDNGVVFTVHNFGPATSALGLETEPSLLDMSPGPNPSDKNGPDTALLLGKTYDDAAANLHFTPIARHEEPGNNYLDVVINKGNAPGNDAPVTTLAAETQIASIGQAVNFTATAIDPNGDPLAVFWDFGDGSFTSNSLGVSHSWNQPGQYVVKSEVSDMKGGASTREVAVTVTIDGTAPTPTITGGASLNGNSPAFPVTVTFEEDVTGFESANLTVLGGAIGAFKALNARTYTFDVTPSGPGIVTIDIAGNVATDSAGNGNNPAAQFRRTIPGVELIVSTATLVEKNGVATISATLSAVSDLNVTVELGFSGTAANVTDYTRTDTRIVIPAGSTSGSLTLSAIADSRIEGPETIVVEVIGVTNGLKSGSQSPLTISLDEVDRALVITSPSHANVAENTPTSTVILDVTTSEMTETGLNFNLSGPDAKAFNISHTTGEITFLSNPDFEAPTDQGTDNVYHVAIIVTDVNQSQRSTTQNLTIAVTPVNDNSPVFNATSPTFTIGENSAVGTWVGTVSASDAEEPVQPVTFAITSGNDSGVFLIDPKTGEIRVASSVPLDFETQSVFHLAVLATDNGTPQRSISTTVTIGLLNVNEGPGLDLGSGPVTAIGTKKVIALPQLTVIGGSVLIGSTLTLDAAVIGTQQKKVDRFMIPSFKNIGKGNPVTITNGHLTLKIQLKPNVSASAVQSFLRKITFSTKGAGLSVSTRTMTVSLTTGGEPLSMVSQTIHVRNTK